MSASALASMSRASEPAAHRSDTLTKSAPEPET